MLITLGKGDCGTQKEGGLGAMEEKDFLSSLGLRMNLERKKPSVASLEADPAATASYSSLPEAGQSERQQKLRCSPAVTRPHGKEERQCPAEPHEGSS